MQSTHGATVSSVSPAAMVFAQATEEQHSSQIPDLGQDSYVKLNVVAFRKTLLRSVIIKFHTNEADMT